MNVAHSANTHAAKAGAGIHHAKGTAGVGAGSGADAGDQGFMALFNALGMDADSDTSSGVGKDGLAALAATGVGLEAGATASGLSAVDPLAVAAQAAQAGGVGGAGVPTAAADATASDLAADPGRGAVAAAGALATGKDAAGATVLPQGAAVAGDAAAASSDGAADGTALPAAAAGAQPTHVLVKAESDLMKALKAQLQAADATGGAAAGAVPSGPSSTAQGQVDDKTQLAGNTATSAAKPSDVQLADSKLAAQLRMADPGSQAGAMAQQAPATETLVLAASADGAIREAQRALEKSASRPGSMAADAGTPGQGFAVTHGAIIDKPSASVDVVSAQATPDVQVAEQVSYWVSRDVQNAELKLDGLGSKPVEVSISVVGQEAHVEFRTDQPEIRQVLENAMPHLKEMLQNEGLTLSGTTVGTSAQGGQASQGQRDRAEARQAKMVLASLAPAQGARAMASGMGGAVDYFV